MPFIPNYIGAQATGKGLPAKTATSAASMECPCLCIVDYSYEKRHLSSYASASRPPTKALRGKNKES